MLEYSEKQPHRIRRWAPGLALVLGVLTLGIRPSISADQPAQVFTVPQGQIENVRFEQMTGGVLHVFYDLISEDPDAVFSVELHVSQDAGATFDMIPPSVSGDVGSGITPGVGKRIVWNAGRDVERLQIEQFRFRIVTEAAVAAPELATLAILTEPVEVAVYLDGDPRGETPVVFEDLPPGDYRVTLTKDGYLDNSRLITLEPGRTELDVTLTPVEAAVDEGGGNALKIVLPIVGVAAAAAGLALGGGVTDDQGFDPSIPVTPNRPPTSSGRFSVDPPNRIGLASATDFFFGAPVVRDLDGDFVTFNWQFGDGNSSDGFDPSHTYTDPGTYQVVLTASDGQNPPVRIDSRTITVKSLTSTWTVGNSPARFDLTQNRNRCSGTFTTSAGDVGPVTACRIRSSCSVNCALELLNAVTDGGSTR